MRCHPHYIRQQDALQLAGGWITQSLSPSGFDTLSIRTYGYPTPLRRLAHASIAKSTTV